uniref:Uncharacterized protein n=1 Tax=Anguilla anguilla TaxID=7936 RepID=A0A0E9V598_ANGAN
MAEVYFCKFYWLHITLLDGKEFD